MENTGTQLTSREIRVKANHIHKIQKQIPRWVWVQLLRSFTAKIRPHKKVYLIKGNRIHPAQILDAKMAQLVFIDNTGKGHLRQRKLPMRFFTVVEAHTWKGKWAGPKGARYDLDTEWDCCGLKDLREVTIRSLTKAQAKKKFKPPTAGEAWKQRGVDVDFSKTWGIKSKYVAPRDQIVWLKVQHRTLWVAKNGGMEGTKCLAQGCNHEESQQHLIECRMIKEYFWRRVVEIAEDLGLLPECTKTRDFRMSVQKWGSLLIAGQIDGKVVSKEATAVLCWAWRALYAEIISKRTGNQGALDFERAVWITYRYAFSRVTAEGYKWRRWYLRQRFWQEGKRKNMAEKYRHSCLLQYDEEANYTLNTKLKDIQAELRK